MTLGDGKPCKRCGKNEYDPRGNCRECARRRTRKWVKDNPDRKRENDRKYYYENRERLLERGREYQRENWDKHLEASRRYRRRNPKKTRRAVRRWELRNRDKLIAYQHKRRARVRNAGGDYTVAEWKRLCKQYNNRCLACGRDDVKLTPDHVIPISKGGSNDISNIQPLCLSCNQSKNDKTIDYRDKPVLKRWIQQELF